MNRSLISFIASVCVATSAAAQQTGWHSVVEANGSTLFGATSQTLAALAATLSHTGEGFTADANVKIRYGESENDARETFVSSRSWAFATTFDALPQGRISPFFFGSVESSLEKRIDRRSAGGVGVKWVFAATNTGKASISLAALAERTTPMVDSLPVSSTTLARWSWRVKMEQRIDERLSFSHVSFYAPTMSSFDGYTITSTSVGNYALNKAVSLTLTFIDNYDSQARSRGAPTNNDGSLLFGVRGSF